MTVRVQEPAQATVVPARDAFRADIQGLRAISVLMVVLFHVNDSIVGGGFFGVDVFFVISGFLITSLLLREYKARKSINLLAFLARRARRLLPNATLVLLFVLLIGSILLSPFEFGPLASDVFAAALYFANFHFASTSVDYFLSNRNPSAVVHFWSLSIEEQFYLIWPSVLLLIGLTRRALPFKNLAAVALALVWIGSFAFCLYAVSISQPLAFFNSGARVWELATGALLAVYQVEVGRLLRPVRELAAAAGLAMVLGAAVFLTEAIVHPGLWTLLPVSGAVLLIASGNDGPPTWVGRLIGWEPMVAIGDRSYSIYLWHWPFIVFALILFPGAEWVAAAAVLASLIPSELAFRYVETPIRHTRVLAGRYKLQLASAALLIAGLAVAPAIAVAVPDVLSGGQRSQWADRIWAAANDTGKAYSDGCHLDSPPLEQPDCLYGNPNAPYTAILFGDSHAAHWFPALEALAGNDWKVHTWSKSSCPSARIEGWNPYERAPYTACSEWRDEMLARMTASVGPLLVILSSSNGYSGWSMSKDGTVLRDAEADLEFERGLGETVDILTGAGHRVAIIRDTPLAEVSYKDCIFANMGGAGCERPRQRALNPNLIEQRVAAAHPGVFLLDVSDLMCGPQTCPVVINDTIVYRDDSHMTATFAATLASALAEILAAAAATWQTGAGAG